MALEKQIRFGSRLVEVVRLQKISILVSLPTTIKDGIGGKLGKLSQKRLFTLADGHRGELSRLTQNRDHGFHLLCKYLLVLQLHRKHSNCLILDAVEGCNLAKVYRFDVHFSFFINLDTLGILEVFNSLFDQL